MNNICILHHWIGKPTTFEVKRSKVNKPHIETQTPPQTQTPHWNPNQTQTKPKPKPHIETQTPQPTFNPKPNPNPKIINHFYILFYKFQTAQQIIIIIIIINTSITEQGEKVFQLKSFFFLLLFFQFCRENEVSVVYSLKK